MVVHGRQAAEQKEEEEDEYQTLSREETIGDY